MVEAMKEKDFFKVFFNWTMNSGVVYYRMINFAKFMRRQKGVQVAYSKFDPNNQMIVEWESKMAEGGEVMTKIIKDMDMLMDVADISVWQLAHEKISYSLFRAYRDKFNKKKSILMEADDFYFGVNPENIGADSYRPNSNLEYYAEMQFRNANGVIVSTPYLKEQYEKYNPCIHVIPNSIDFEAWNFKKKANNGKVRIGFSGGGAHVYDLKVMAKVIPIILDMHKNAEFMFLGFMPEYISTGRRVRHIHKWYGIDQYPAELNKLGFDIGIAPLRDNQFNRGKSNLRWLEYSALGIPTVASPVRPFTDSIISHKTGLFAQEVDEWVDCLDLLINDEDLRKSIGDNANDAVRKDYNASTIAVKYLDLLKGIAGGKEKINMTQHDEGSTVVEL